MKKIDQTVVGETPEHPLEKREHHRSGAIGSTTTIPLFQVRMSAAAAPAVAEVLESGYIGQGPRWTASSRRCRECWVILRR